MVTDPALPLTGIPFTSRNLVLTGYVEPNKPRVAQQVGAQLAMPVVDAERLLEDRLGDTMERIRSSYGERRLKTVEAELMQEVLLRRNSVIRVNGSTLMHGSHLARMQETSIVVCLVARLDSLLQKLHVSLGARYHNPAERAMEMGLLRREWAVRGKPGVHEIDATGVSEVELVQTIVAFWQKAAIERA